MMPSDSQPQFLVLVTRQVTSCFTHPEETRFFKQEWRILQPWMISLSLRNLRRTRLHNLNSTHQWRWGCSWRLRYQNHWWLCRCRSLCRLPPPPWSLAPCGGYGNGSSRCGCCVHLWSTLWVVEGLLPLDMATWWQSRAVLSVGEQPCQKPAEGLRTQKWSMVHFTNVVSAKKHIMWTIFLAIINLKSISFRLI